MYDLIILLGSMGAGKTTVARILKEKLDSPHIDYDWIRGFHLNKKWSNMNDNERKMSLGNLVFILKNYIKHDYKNIIISGFRNYDLNKILQEFTDNKVIIFTLVLTDDNILKQRVLTESRDSGWRDYEESIKSNRKLRDNLKYPNEHKIDNTNQTPEETANQIIELLSQ